MRKWMIKIFSWHKKGSYTVEASLLMIIIITLLTAIIYLGFFLHDRAYLQNAAYETALAGSLNQKENDIQSKVERKKNEFLTGRLMGTKKVSGSVDAGKEKITVCFQGDFPVPGLIIQYFFRKSLSIKAEVSLSLKDPKSTVNKIHGIDKLRKQVSQTDSAASSLQPDEVNPVKLRGSAQGARVPFRAYRMSKKRGQERGKERQDESIIPA